MTTARSRMIAPSLLFVGALAVYGWQASRTALFDTGLAVQDRYLSAISRPSVNTPAVDEATARAYWARYPDVARDVFYGPAGALGLRGAWQHYRDHGRHERRRWEP